jgi:hypothetical protein
VARVTGDSLFLKKLLVYILNHPDHLTSPFFSVHIVKGKIFLFMAESAFYTEAFSDITHHSCQFRFIEMIELLDVFIIRCSRTFSFPGSERRKAWFTLSGAGSI